MSRLCLITALPAETRPFLDALNLHQLSVPHLRLYGSEHYLLLETGIGKLNAAATTGAVLNAYPDIRAIANIGIAGGFYDYASTLVANHVYDAATGAQWYPHLPAAPAFRQISSARIDTLDKPSTEYRQGRLFDMEASGVFSAASRYLSSSQIHSIKVVSDNPQHEPEQISKASVMQIVGQSLPDIVPMLDVLIENFVVTEPSAESTAAEETVQQALQATHHSVNDERLLRRLVLQYLALTRKPPVLEIHNSSATNIRRQLQLELNAQPFNYESR